tara:strand:+ start:377 stop:571 length:195 start_codon:yes stop_codon:yes gene_type:complete
MYLNGKSYRAYAIGETLPMLLNQRLPSNAGASPYDAGFATSGAMMMEVKEITQKKWGIVYAPDC